MRSSFRLSVFLALALACGPGTATRAEEDPEPFACPIKALLAGEDAGLRRVYDGIRKGLEQAQLPRVCLETLDEDAVATLAALEADPPPLVFVLGKEAARLLGTRLASRPRVYVDTAWSAEGVLVPPAPPVEAPGAVVRGVTSATRLHEVLDDLFGGLATVAFAPGWKTPEEEGALQRFVRSAAIPARTGEDPGTVVFHHRLFARDEAPRLDLLVQGARARRQPLISDDLALWGRGAAIVIAPDHFLLGRVAADTGRRLIEATAPLRLERVVALTEVRVDIEEAVRQGLTLPVPFLAGADVLRGTPEALARTGGAR